VRTVGSAALGLLVLFVAIFTEFIAGLFLLPQIPGTECGWLICGEDRLPTVSEWLVYSVVACAVISLPAWGVFVVAGLKPPWVAYAAGLATTIASHLIIVLDILPALDPASHTSDLTLPALTALWVLAPAAAAVAAWRFRHSGRSSPTAEPPVSTEASRESW
jgi:hypothetical protein